MDSASEFAYRSVDALPEQLQANVLYHSKLYAIASHLCACGCGFEAVTRIDPDWYTLRITEGKPTLAPSIGNASFPCRSHYYIRNGRVDWAGEYTPSMIAIARRLDNPRAHPEPAPPKRRGPLARFWAWIARTFPRRTP